MNKSQYLIFILSALQCAGCDSGESARDAADLKVDALLLEMEEAEIKPSLDTSASYDAFIEELGQLNSAMAFAEAGKDEKYKPAASVDSLPSFPGGVTALYNYLLSEIIDLNVTGFAQKAVILVNIDTEGHIDHISIVQSSGDEALDIKAKGVIEKMPPWKPGSNKGEAVATKYLIPMNFDQN